MSRPSRQRSRRSPSPTQRAQRIAAAPQPTFDDALPISAKRDVIADAIRDQQVVIIAGETGSGKTTQLPKICLQLGRGIDGQIGHTQPRRLAARTVAERIAAELKVEVGGPVGYAVRFADRVSRDSYIKVMTDGILLAEIQRDRLLRRYDTIIIDEAHERSLNIDFILGYLKTLLPKRPDLKVIITSATIDPEAFSKHFNDAPIIEVSGRTYPVEVRYRPIVDPDDPSTADRDLVQGVIDAVRELGSEAPGDVLCFLSGEREIRDVADALRDLGLPNTEILPLFARLSVAEQHRVFSGHRGRRIVLATNVAETSLTVPGIKYVIDAGTARISRYSHATKVQRLPIEAISKASAAQRSGRCGRTSDGIAIRLYSEADFADRPDFTDPEITRTNLASVILQMIAAGLGDISAFPFIDAPDKRNIADGMALLRELDAINEDATALTETGRKLVALPIDPRLGRMIVEGERRGNAHAVMVVAAGLSIQDPRERPADKGAQADQSHARFIDKTSDFLGLLNLWKYLREQQKSLSSNQFRKLCQREYINYLRVREWQDLVAQLRQIASTVGIHTAKFSVDDEAVHKSVLAGLLSQIGMQDVANKREYIGGRNARFAIFPGSALFKKNPPFVVTAELVETSRLWARVVARIDPAWAEEVGAHLVKRSYNEPHWERKRASVVASEKVTLFGVRIIADRKVNFGRIDPALSRELFIREALVQGDWDTRHHFLRDNQRLIEQLGELEDKARRRDIIADDEDLFSFYDARIPESIVSGRHFDKWWKNQRHETPNLLTFTEADALRAGADRPSADYYPDVFRAGERPLDLTYTFDPATVESGKTEAVTDGVSVDIPLVALQEADSGEFEWLVPGHREALVVALIKSLPKAVRRHVVPAPDRARAVLPLLDPNDGALLPQLAERLRSQTGAAVTSADFDWSKVPDHLRMTFRIVDESGKLVATGKDLDALKTKLAPQQRAQVAAVARNLERAGITRWDIDRLDRAVTLNTAHGEVAGYPTLRVDGTSVSLQVATSPGAQAAMLRAATAWLLARELPSVASQVMRTLAAQQKMSLTQAPHPSPTALYDDVLQAVLEGVVDEGGLPFSRSDFDALLARARTGLSARVLAAFEKTAAVLAAKLAAERDLGELTHPEFARSVDDMRTQLGQLLPADFVSRHGAARLADLERYVQGVAVRASRLRQHRAADARGMLEFELVREEYDDLAAQFPPAEPLPESMVRIRWMLEEFRLALFAQSIRTAYSVSAQRIRKALDQV